MSLIDKPGEPSTPKEGSIPLYVINGVATVWDAQTAATLHCQHDISGLRAGTLPGVVQQNAFLGLPVTLMMEEATHLVRKGIAHLIHVPTNTSPPPAALVEARTAARVARSRALAERMRADDAVKSKAQKAKALNASGAGGDKARLKREERGRKRAEAARTAALAAGADEAVVHKAYEEAIAALSAPVAKKEEPEHEVVLPAPTAENSNIFTVVAGTPVLPDLTPRTPATLASPAFPFPATLRDAAVADAFSALHERGLRMGLGPRFGGEYLVYPGDYLRYHAHFTSQVIVRDEPIRPAELVAWGRLGTGTKKAGLLCCWDDGGSGEEEAKGKGEVEFYSLEWANFG